MCVVSLPRACPGGIRSATEPAASNYRLSGQPRDLDSATLVRLSRWIRIAARERDRPCSAAATLAPARAPGETAVRTRREHQPVHARPPAGHSSEGFGFSPAQAGFPLVGLMAARSSRVHRASTSVHGSDFGVERVEQLDCVLATVAGEMARGGRTAPSLFSPLVPRQPAPGRAAPPRRSARAPPVASTRSLFLNIS